MTRCSITAAAMLVFAGAAPVWAQIGNPAGMDPATATNAPAPSAPRGANAQDELFVLLLGMGSRAEVEAGRMAEGKASRPAVKDFARRMVEDHSKGNEQLTALADRHRMTLPKDVAPEHKAMRQQLESLSGAALDLAYLRGQLVEHQKTAQLLEWEIGMGQNPQLVRFASAMLPVVLEHLETVQRLWSETTGAAPAGLAATASTQAAMAAGR
jgi:putative membrane protein